MDFIYGYMIFAVAHVFFTFGCYFLGPVFDKVLMNGSERINEFNFAVLGVNFLLIAASIVIGGASG